MSEIRLCSRCVCNSTIPGIFFDDKGVCSLCQSYDILESEFPEGEATENKLIELFNKIKNSNIKKRYDCIVGISGGTDSIYTLFVAKKYGLNPLAVHIDDGWNTIISQENIDNAVKILNVDLHKIVVDHDELVDLTRSFIQSSVPDVEVPTDIAILGSLYRYANKIGVKYVLTGSSFKTEGKMPPGWSYGDGKYLKSVHKKYGAKPLKNYPNVLLFDYVYYNIIKKIRIVQPLYYVPYVKKDVKNLLTKELMWKDYGEGHHESLYTRFVQGYLLPSKFGIDKRIIHYSAQIRSGQMTRDEALRKLDTSSYDIKCLEEDIKLFTLKLHMTNEEFVSILNEKPRDRTEFKSYYNLVRKFRFVINYAYRLNLFPTRIYGNYDR